MVIAITGSVGKTTTKEAIFSVLKKEYNDQVRVSHGNLNTELGLPLAVLGYNKLPSKLLWPALLIFAWVRSKSSKYPRYLVLEMGVDKPNDMEYFMSFVKPDVSIITALSSAHLGNFKTLKEYREEKLKLFKNTRDNGAKIYNGDDEYFTKNPIPDGCEFSKKNKQSDCFASNIEISINGTKYDVNCANEKISIKNKIIGKHLIYSQLAAVSVGKYLKISKERIESALCSLKPIPGRMNFLRGKKNVQIIDDTYNSSPGAVKSALDTIDEIENENRKVAILGNMNELGKFEKPLHEEIGAYAKGKVDLAVFVGENADIMAKGYGAGKFLKFSNRDELVDRLSQIIKSNDIVLIKASQNNNYFEEVVKTMLDGSIDPDKVLVRQEKFWMKKKNIG